MTQAIYEPDITASSGTPVTYSAGSLQETSGNFPQQASRGIPPAISMAQAYYWTHAWQRGERETQHDLARGDVRVFKTAGEAIQYLFSHDD